MSEIPDLYVIRLFRKRILKLNLGSCAETTENKIIDADSQNQITYKVFCGRTKKTPNKHHTKNALPTEIEQRAHPT
jgi:hypothetical protein